MGNFKLPVRQFIINDDIQGVLRADKAGTFSDYGGATDLDPATATHLFKITGQTDWTKVTDLQELASAVRVRKQVWASAVKPIKAYTVTSSAVSAGDVFRIVWDSLDKTPVEYQNIPLEKRYQFSADQATVANVIANMVAVINADENSPVVAYAGFNNATPAQDDSDKIVLIAKNFREDFEIYPSTNGTLALTEVAAGTTVYHTVEDTNDDTVAASDYVNDYENLKNKQWVADLDFDRNAEYFPQKGAKYNSYFYKVDFTQDTGGHTVPGQKAVTGEVTFIFYVKQGIALDTALDAFATDMNV